MCVCWCVT